MRKTETITRVTKFTILFLFLIAPAVLFGQGNGKVLTQTVRGTVIDAASGYRLAYAVGCTHWEAGNGGDHGQFGTLYD